MGTEPGGAYVPVRAFASNRVHLADRPATARAEAYGSPYMAVLLPAVMLCRVVLRNGGAVRMKDDTKVTCRTCAALGRPDSAASS